MLEEGCAIHHFHIDTTDPATMSEETGAQVRQVVQAICRAWADFQANTIERVTLTASGVRPRRF